MKAFNNLTTWEKIMNMAKLGTVSTCGKDFHGSLKSNKINVLGLTPYTLCEVKDKLCRNRNRHSFAFYISGIIGRSPLVDLLHGLPLALRKSGSYVIPGQMLMGEHKFQPSKNAASPVLQGLHGFIPPLKTVPPFLTNFNGFAACFFPSKNGSSFTGSPRRYCLRKLGRPVARLPERPQRREDTPPAVQEAAMNNAVLLVLAVSVIAAGLVASLWENPPDGRFSRQRRAGIFHRLLAKLWRSVVLAAAWWVLNVVSPPATAIYEPALAVGQKFWPSYAERVAEFLEMELVPFLLLDFIVWPIAEDFLRAKLKAQREEENRSTP